MRFTDHSDANEPRVERPLALTVLCLLGWLAVALAAWRIVTQWDVFSRLPSAHVAGAPLALVVTAVSLLGYWKMRRWGLWLISAGLLARILTGFTGTLPLRPLDLMWPVVMVLLGLSYFRRLS
ncbi:MAG: hypothetical protein JSU87_17955 [Gemmatimonadota bacterium]|nr:MAG: hypothetical protein JSU87_17955 [Gemmatimonadota bacterium]